MASSGGKRIKGTFLTGAQMKTYRKATRSGSTHGRAVKAAKKPVKR